RLLTTPTELAQTQALLTTDPLVADWYARANDAAADMLAAPPLPFGDAEREQDLNEARALMQELVTLSGLYLLDHDAAKLARAKETLLRTAEFDEWGVMLLAIAELTFGVAIAYA